MPWKVSHPVNERMKFIVRLEEGERMTDLCREFEISRKTGYKFLERYRKFGAAGLFDESHCPIRTPHRTPEEIVNLILNTKQDKPSWGAPKICAYLKRKHESLRVPSIPTIHGILDRNGLVKRRKRRRQTDLITKNAMIEGPNQLWSADFKGQFRLGNGNYCYPLTVTDNFSRFLLGCEALEGTQTRPAIAVFKNIFREFGLPERIRTDNGCPFGHPKGLFGLSQLSIWFLRLGIALERIEPGHPEQNGRHERMHLTLKLATTRPSASNSLAQQEKFDSFVQEYNRERPHEALNGQVPSDFYKSSPRVYPESLVTPKYPLHDLTRVVYHNGHVFLRGRDESFFLGRTFAGETIGMREEDDDIWLVSFLTYDLGFYHRATKTFSPMEKLFI